MTRTLAAAALVILTAFTYVSADQGAEQKPVPPRSPTYPTPAPVPNPPEPQEFSARTR